MGGGGIRPGHCGDRSIHCITYWFMPKIFVTVFIFSEMFSFLFFMLIFSIFSFKTMSSLLVYCDFVDLIYVFWLSCIQIFKMVLMLYILFLIEIVGQNNDYLNDNTYSIIFQCPDIYQMGLFLA